MRIKNVLSFFLVLCLFLCFGIHIKEKTAFSSTTKLKKTLFVNEKFVFRPVTASNTFKSAKSSNKKIATVKKNSKKKITITAKKAGKATITIKTKFSITYKYIITVKKKSTSWKAFTPYNVIDGNTSRYTSYVMFEVTNTSGIFASGCNVEYSLYNSKNAVIANGSVTLEKMLPDSKVHFFGGAGSLTEKVSKGKITKISLAQDDVSKKYKYTNQNKNISIAEVSKDDISLKLNIKNKYSETITGTAEIIFFKDTKQKYPIGMSSVNLNISAGASNTASVAAIKGYESYRIYKRAYVTKWVG